MSAKRRFVKACSGLVDLGVPCVPPADVHRLEDESDAARDQDQGVEPEAFDLHLRIRDLRSTLDAVVQVPGYEAQVHVPVGVQNRPAVPDRRRFSIFEEACVDRGRHRHEEVNEEDDQDGEPGPGDRGGDRLDRGEYRSSEQRDQYDRGVCHEPGDRLGDMAVAQKERQHHRECVEHRTDEAIDPVAIAKHRVALVGASEAVVDDGDVVRGE